MEHTASHKLNVFTIFVCDQYCTKLPKVVDFCTLTWMTEKPLFRDSFNILMMLKNLFAVLLLQPWTSLQFLTIFLLFLLLNSSFRCLFLVRAVPYKDTFGFKRVLFKWLGFRKLFSEKRSNVLKNISETETCLACPDFQPVVHLLILLSLVVKLVCVGQLNPSLQVFLAKSHHMTLESPCLFFLMVSTILLYLALSSVAFCI